MMEERMISLYIEIEKLFYEHYKEYKDFKRYGKAFNYGKLTAYYRCLQEIKKHFDFIQFEEAENDFIRITEKPWRVD